MARRPLLPLAAAALAGLLFGLGLAFSQMTDPAKVKAFLDVAAIGVGGWDPSLAFVMGAGLLTAALVFRLSRPMARPIAGSAFTPQARQTIDGRLVGGAALFGIGWGVSGLCPGPAIADLGLAPGEVAWFVAAMLGGSWVTGRVLAGRGGTGPAPAPGIPAAAE